MQDITEKFGADLKAMAAGDYDDWADETLSSVAGVILMDQFSRNVYRNTAQMYALDPKALEWALKLIVSGAMAAVQHNQQAFAGPQQ